MLDLKYKGKHATEGKELVKVSVIAGAKRGACMAFEMDELAKLQVRGRDQKGVGTSSDMDCSVTVVDAGTGETMFTCVFGGAGERKYAVRSLAWSPDGKQLVVVGDFGKAHVLDAEAGIIINTIHESTQKVSGEWGHCSRIAEYEPATPLQ